MDGITNTVDMGLRKFWEVVKDREAGHTAAHGVTKRQTRLNKTNGKTPPLPVSRQNGLTSWTA